MAIVLAVVLADATLYHGAGYAGIAALFAGLGILFPFAATGRRSLLSTAFFFVLLLLLAVKLLWCGNVVLVILGGLVLFCLAAIQAGRRLECPEAMIYLFQSLVSAPAVFRSYMCRCRNTLRFPGFFTWMSVLFPVLAVFIFGTIFILANPDLIERTAQIWNRFLDELARISRWVPFPSQIFFWIVIAYFTAGFLRPRPTGIAMVVDAGIDGARKIAAAGNEIRGILANEHHRDVAAKTGEERQESVSSAQDHSSPFYAPCRNMLWAVIALFALYLVFEYKTNLTRDFPKGFDYSRHMHNGAAFLTFALAVSTFVLSVVFQGRLLRDSRIGKLKRLAWIWSALNFLLAIAVFNRLFIYIDLNGLSRLRIIGLLGTAAVVLGFVMVMRKIAMEKRLSWLLHRFAWCVFSMVFLGMVLPVDWYIGHYNTTRVAGGDLAPSIFLLRNNSEEELLASLPLLDSKDEIIRDGARAFFAQALLRLWAEGEPTTLSDDSGSSFRSYRWTAFQWSDALLRKRLEARSDEMRKYLDSAGERDSAIKQFQRYTDRWI